MLIQDYIPRNLLAKSLFYPGYFECKFSIDLVNSKVTPEISSNEWQTGDRLLLTADGFLPSNLQAVMDDTYQITTINNSQSFMTTSESIWKTGMKVTLSCADDLPVPFTEDKEYYVITSSDNVNQFSLAASYQDAINGVPITIISTGSSEYPTYIQVVGVVVYLIVPSDTKTPVMFASTYQNALNLLHITFSDTGYGIFTLLYFGRNPSITDLIQWALNTYGDYSEISGKYKDINRNVDVAAEIIKEYGYEYVLNVLQLGPYSIKTILDTIYIIHALKGTKKGLQFILDQTGITYSLKEWWEYPSTDTTNHIPTTFTGLFDIYVGQPFKNDIMIRLISFLRNYVYPLCRFTLRITIDFVDPYVIMGGFADQLYICSWGPLYTPKVNQMDTVNIGNEVIRMDITPLRMVAGESVVVHEVPLMTMNSILLETGDYLMTEGDDYIVTQE